jgi:phosphocarrier protein HPr
LPKVTRKLRIINAMGLHTRPATAIVKLLQNCHSEVHFNYRGEMANAKSILGLLTLAAAYGARIQVSVEGADALEVIDKLEEAFQNGFGEGQ